MSYILDALRRAQAERERGQVPGLDAQPAGYAPAAHALRGVPMARAASAFGLALLAIAALVAWWWPRQLPVAVPAAASAPAQPRRAAEAPAPVVPAPLPQVVSAPAPPLPPPVAAIARAAAPAVPQAPARAPTPADLAPDQRRELPALAVGGSVWSDNAAARFVVINGQVVREGESAAPGVIVERIAPKAALLRWRGMAIELPL